MSRWLCRATSGRIASSVSREKSSNRRSGSHGPAYPTMPSGVSTAAMGPTGACATSEPSTIAWFGCGDGVAWASSIVTVQWQCGVRSAGTRGGRWIGRTAALRVRGQRGRVERRVLDRVAHAAHPLVAHRLDVHQRAAVVEPELAVLVVDHLHPEVHELRRRADVDLDVLEDHLGGGAAEAEQLLRAHRVDRRRRHPLVDRDLLRLLPFEALLVEERDADAVLEVAVEQPFAQEHRELVARERVERRRDDGRGRRRHRVSDQ